MGLFGRTSLVKHKRRTKFKKYKQYRYKLGNRNLHVQGYEPQALNYLQQFFSPEQILCECENKVPIIRYSYRKKYRDYIPDIYIPNKTLIVEVKSMKTLGLLNNKQRGWSMTCAKAIACHKKGYKFCLLLMDSDGTRLKMPKNWAYMPKQECVDWVHTHNKRRKIALI